MVSAENSNRTKQCRNKYANSLDNVLHVHATFGLCRGIIQFCSGRVFVKL
uniref:Uncharacterized protein n=1 Tax=Nelumbo nucifera TaxID=4432 RepID=A0A822YFU2_NELNU|nr:TPA_asm: hypothetical protein HUJ06_010143 [Nelumbo nucifera]